LPAGGAPFLDFILELGQGLRQLLLYGIFRSSQPIGGNAIRRACQ
jgi:hypothetical protein